MFDSLISKKNGMDPVVKIHDLTAFYISSFQKITLFDHANMDFYPGEFYGISAENGSGKTSLCQFILGLKEPQCMKLQMCGHTFEGKRTNNWRRLLKTRVFYFPYGVAEERDLSIRRYSLSLLREFYQQDPARIKDVCQEINISVEFVLEGKIKSLSLLLLLGALCGPWSLIILDEPFLKGEEYSNLQKIILLLKKKSQEENSCIILISHGLEELEACSQVLTIKNGKILPFEKRENPHESELKIKHISIPHLEKAPTLFRVENFPIFCEISQKIKPTSFSLSKGETILLSDKRNKESYNLLVESLSKFSRNKKVKSRECVRIFYKESEVFPIYKYPNKNFFWNITLLENAQRTFAQDVKFCAFFKALFIAEFKSKHYRNQENFPYKREDFLQKRFIRLACLIQDFFLPKDILTRTLGQVSAGQAQKLNLCIAFLRKTDLIFLKNPTQALDNKSVEQIIFELVQLKKSGSVLVLLTGDDRLSSLLS